MTDALVVKQLHKWYGRHKHALCGIDISIKKQDFFALLGPNGAGKTTFLGILSTLVSKSQGYVHVLGYDLDTHASQAKSKLGVMPQEFNFSPFETLLDTLVYQAGYFGIPTQRANSRAKTLLQTLNLWDQRHQKILTLSGGMKRKLMLARALVNEPELLILDEPTANIDIETRNQLWRYFKWINEQGTTIILTTHNLPEAELLCDKIAIINEGKISTNTSMATLLQHTTQEEYIIELTHPLNALAQSLQTLGFSQLSPQKLKLTLHKNQTLGSRLTALHHHEITVESIHNLHNKLESIYERMLEKSGDH